MENIKKDIYGENEKISYKDFFFFHKNSAKTLNNKFDDNYSLN